MVARDDAAARRRRAREDVRAVGVDSLHSIVQMREVCWPRGNRGDRQRHERRLLAAASCRRRTVTRRQRARGLPGVAARRRAARPRWTFAAGDHAARAEAPAVMWPVTRMTSSASTSAAPARFACALLTMSRRARAEVAEQFTQVPIPPMPPIRVERVYRITPPPNLPIILAVEAVSTSGRRFGFTSAIVRIRSSMPRAAGHARRRRRRPCNPAPSRHPTWRP